MRLIVFSLLGILLSACAAESSHDAPEAAVASPTVSTQTSISDMPEGETLRLGARRLLLGFDSRRFCDTVADLPDDEAYATLVAISDGELQRESSTIENLAGAILKEECDRMY